MNDEPMKTNLGEIIAAHERTIRQLERALVDATNENMQLRNPEVRMLDMKQRDGVTYLEFTGVMVRTMGGIMYDWMVAQGGLNLVEMEAQRPDGDPMILSIRRKEGKTAIELKNEVERENERLRARLAVLEQYKSKEWQEAADAEEKAIIKYQANEQQRRALLAAAQNCMATGELSERVYGMLDAAIKGESVLPGAKPESAKTLPQFREGEQIDITGGVESSEYVRRLREED